MYTTEYTIVTILPRWPHQQQDLGHFFQRRCPRNVMKQLIKALMPLFHKQPAIILIDKCYSHRYQLFIE